MPILNLRNSDTPTEMSCDIAVVGAGAVGITMAVALARRGCDVLLLEAGGVNLEAQSQALFKNARAVGRAHDGIHSGRFRLLGGTTNFWGGQLVRYDPIVFERRDWLGAPAWPLAASSLAPYYDAAMQVLGMADAAEHDDIVWRRANTTPPDFGEELELFLTRWAREPNFAIQFRRDLAGPALRTVVNAAVTALAPDDSGTRIARLHVRSLNGRQARIAANRVVLACGTLEIARLLMLPFADGRDTPWQRNPWLGHGYLDHIDTTAGIVSPLNQAAFRDLFENMFFDGYKYNPKLKLSEAAQRRHGLAGVAGAFLFRTSLQEHAEAVRLFVRSVRAGQRPTNVLRLPQHAIALSRVALPFLLRHLRSNRAFHPSSATILLRVTVEQLPRHDSRIVLRSDRDALDMPMIDVDWRVDGREIETIAHFAEQVRDALRRANLAELAIDGRLAARDPAFLADGTDTYHQMGGAQMGRTPQDGVVDPDLAVFGIDGLYVAGAAVMPSTGFANCTLTAIALGLRLGDLLAKETTRRGHGAADVRTEPGIPNAFA